MKALPFKLPFLKKRKKTLAAVRLQGVIQSKGRAALSLSNVAGPLDQAFKKGDAVALVINSPGGSPAQSQLIHDFVRDRAEHHKKPVHVFVEDVAASGGYWLALAGDDIAGLPTSIIGSIGVISAGFGFVEALGKLGIERRTTTAGENKIRLDPFAPLKPEDVAWQKTLQTDLHKIFIETVQKRRSEQGTTLPEDGPLFTGDVWLGQAAKENGLIDRIDSLTAFARREDYKLRPFGGRRRSWLSGLVGLDAETRTQSWIDPEAALDALETRLEDRIRRQALGQ